MWGVMPKQQGQDTKTETECVHFWVIKPAQGPLSKGRCKRCKLTKDFENSVWADPKHITLAKDQGERRKWNKWYGDTR